MGERRKPTHLEELIAAPKGRLEAVKGQAFLLHVFWEAPSAEAARELVATQLRVCAAATRRDTPCVPTYFFRRSGIDADLASPAPRLVADHPWLREGLRKRSVGVSAAAVRADLVRHRIDPAFVDSVLAQDPEQAAAMELPAQLRSIPVIVEFNELYLDERAFMDHAGSRDYLSAYGQVMSPAMLLRPAGTVRLGTPVSSLVERILDPMLHEIVRPVPEGCFVFRPPLQAPSAPVMLSLDVPGAGGADASAQVAAALPSSLCEQCTSFLAFEHPLRPQTTRVMCILSELPTSHFLGALAALHPARGEAHTETPEAARALVSLLTASGLGMVLTNPAEASGHIVHEKASSLLLVPST